MGKPKSITEKDSTLVERIIGKTHWKTTITNGKDKVVRTGQSPDKSEKRASESWKGKK